jgi:uncharacterized protein YndB with AHSA1/START domain
MTEIALTPVVCTVEIAAPRERVFELFTEPAELVKWWPDAVALEPREGGDVHLEFPNGDVNGTITTFDPPAALGFTWVRSAAPDVVTQVDVELTETDDGGTRVELRHTGWESVPEEQVEEWRMIHEAGWNHFLGCLRDLAEGKPVDKQWRPS